MSLIVNQRGTCISMVDFYDSERHAIVDEQCRVIPAAVSKQLSPLSLILHHDRREVAHPIDDAYLQVAAVVDTQAELTSL